MNKQIAQVTWSRGCYADIFRTAIVEPSPIKEGQQVCYLGQVKKGIFSSLDLLPIRASPTPVQQALPQHQAKAKKKTGKSYFLHFHCTFFSLSLLIFCLLLVQSDY